MKNYLKIQFINEENEEVTKVFKNITYYNTGEKQKYYSVNSKRKLLLSKFYVIYNFTEDKPELEDLEFFYKSIKVLNFEVIDLFTNY